jgi:hypothetical protein
MALSETPPGTIRWMRTDEPPMARETRLLAAGQADLALKASALAARIADLADREAAEREAVAAEREAVAAERDRLVLDLRAETVKSAALEKRLEALGKSPAHAVERDRDRYQRMADSARAEEESIRDLYEAKCEEVDNLAAEVARLCEALGAKEAHASAPDICGADELKRLQERFDHLSNLLAAAESTRDQAIAKEREALTDLSKVRSCFEAQRKALCDRLGLDATATWADITVRVR